MIASLAHSVIEHAPAVNVAARMVLAATDPTTNDNTDDESKKSGPIGIVVIIVLCVACYFLFKSLSKHLRKVREGEVPVSAVAPNTDTVAAAGETADAEKTDAEVVSVPDLVTDEESAPPPAP